VKTVDLRDFVRFSEDGPVHTQVHETERLWSELVCLDPNQGIGPIADRDSDGVCLVVSGRVAIQVDRSRARLGQWGTAVVPAGSSLVLRNASEEPAVVLLLVAPPPPPRAVTG
jgi:glyoxylate utilization-related uncharacterized protein